MRGLIELAQKNALRIKCERIEYGNAAGFVYALKGLDPANKSCLKIKEVFEACNFDYTALVFYSGKAPCGDFVGFDSVNDEPVVKRR